MASTDIDTQASDFGPNIWLVDEMYRKYLDAPNSVSEAWQDFFSDYQPGGAVSGGRAAGAGELGASRQTAVPEVEQPSAPVPAATAPSPAPQPAVAAEVPANAELLKGASAANRRTDGRKPLGSHRHVGALHSGQAARGQPQDPQQPARRLTLGGKVSFTHLIGWAVVQAVKSRPAMNVAFATFDGKPHLIRPEGINLGLAIDVERKDGTRTLLVPNIKHADRMDFQEFWLAYEDLVRRVRSNQITPDDFAGTTVTLTNPGTIGTVQSVPRLMPDQGLIVGVGAIAYPPEYSGLDPERSWPGWGSAG